MEAEVLKENRTIKETYEELLCYFSGLTDDDKKESLYALMNNAFKDLYMDPNQMGNYMVHNIKTCEERYTLEDFSLALFKYFLYGVEYIIYNRIKELNLE